MAARRNADGAGKTQSHPAPSSSSTSPLDALIVGLAGLDVDALRLQWRNHLGGSPPAHLPRWLLARVLAYRIQALALGDLDKATLRIVRQSSGGGGEDAVVRPFAPRDPSTRDGIGLKAGALLVREWNGRMERVVILDNGFAWRGKTYRSLSQIARAMTGTSWNGHRFFGLRPSREDPPKKSRRPVAGAPSDAAPSIEPRGVGEGGAPPGRVGSGGAP